MKCTHLVRGRNMACRALEKAYVPSLFQLVEYCRSGGHRKCPFYLRGVVSVNGKESPAGTALSFSGM
jgi:hypothetical protein